MEKTRKKQVKTHKIATDTVSVEREIIEDSEPIVNSSISTVETAVQPKKQTYLIANRFLRALLPPSILTLLTAVIYYPSLHYPFQFDDIANIVKRFGIRFDNPLGRWWNSSRWFGDWLSSLNFQVGRFDPFYYRLSNITIHILTGLLLFYLICSLCKFLQNKPFFANNATYIAFICSGLFLLHPVQTQTVSYVIQARLEGLATLFIVTTLLMYVKIFQTRSIILKSIFTFFLLAFAMLSCGTKEIVVALPFLLLTIDWFFISQQKWNLFKKHIWLYGLFSIAFIALLLHHMGTGFALDALMGKISTNNNRGNILTPNAFDVITPSMFFMSELKVILHYLLIFVWPVGISVEYDWKVAPGFFSFEVLFPLIVLLTILFFVVKFMVQKKYTAFTFGLTWFFIAIAPRSTLIPSPELVCDYKTYLSSIGIMFLFATMLTYAITGLWSLLQNLPERFHVHEVQLGTLACLILLVGLGSYERNKVWATCVDFWQDNVSKAPNKARSHNNLGVALSEAGRVDESIAAYQKAISLDSYYADPLSNLAVAYSMKGDIDKAIDSLKGAIHICPNYPEAYNNLGTLLLQKKAYDDAERALSVAIQLRPYYGKAYYNMARLWEEKGDSNKSWEFLKRAAQGDLDTPEVFFKLGQMGMKIQKYDEAAFAFEEVLRRGVANDQVWFNLANAYFMNGKHEKAKPIYERLVMNNPLDPRYLYNLAESYFTQNDFAHAIELFQKVTTLPQSVPQAFFRVAACLEKLNKFDESKKYLQGLLTLNAGDDFKKMVKNEIARSEIQKKVNEGQGTIRLSDLKKALASRNEPGKKNTKKTPQSKQIQPKTKNI